MIWASEGKKIGGGLAADGHFRVQGLMAALIFFIMSGGTSFIL